jgi:diguanylate cyclase (GGDEF)-like protein/PAS domain S-box-containing protein
MYLQNAVPAFLLICLSIVFIYIALRQEENKGYGFIKVMLFMSAGMMMLLLSWFCCWHTILEPLFSVILLVLFFGGTATSLWQYWKKQQVHEGKYRLSERRYYQLMDRSSDPIFIQAGGVIQYANEAALKMMGASSAELILGRNIFEFISPSQWKLAWKNFRQSQNRGFVQFFETEMIRLNGECIIAQIMSQGTEYQEQCAIQFIVRDVTNDRKTEREIMEVKEKLESFFTNSADAMYILNPDRTVVQVNPAFEELFELKEEEIKGKIVPNTFSMSEQERLQYIQKVLDGEVVSGVEAIIYKKDGSKVPVRFTVSPIRDKNGNVTMISGVIRDITVHQEYEQALKESEARYRIIAEHSNDYILVLSKNLMAIYASPAIKSVLGYIPEEVVGNHFYFGVHEEDERRIQKQMHAVLTEHNLITTEYRVCSKNGEWIWLEARFIPMLNEEQELKYIIVSTKDIRERKSYEAKLRKMAFFDALTGIANRRTFEDKLAYMIEKEEPFALAYLDFDNFKEINDLLSHKAGDAFLKEVAKRLQSVIRSSDVAARLGGDEFVLLIPNVQKEEMVMIAERLTQIFQNPFVYKGQEVVSTVSIGIALYPADGKDSDTLLHHADEALYRVKKNGRNHYYFYDEKMNEQYV